MNNLQKTKPWRSKKIMDIAKDVPYCMMCKKQNDQTIIGAHYSGAMQHHFGKGTGQKGTDAAVAYICNHCHTNMDRYFHSNNCIRSESFMLAIIKSHDWLFQNGVFK